MKFKILALFISLLFSFLLGEMIVRVIDHFVLIYDVEMARYATSLKISSSNPDRGHLHKSNSRARLMGVDVITNSMGWRDREYSLSKPPKTYRIMVLGDSMTLGWGGEQEECYPKKLEKMLCENISSKTGLNYEVINTAVGNYNTVQELAYLKDDGYRINPDMIILGFYINDAEPVPRKTQSAFLNHSHLAVLFWSKINAVMSGIFKKGNNVEYYNNLYGDSCPGWMRCKNALVELNDYCINNNKKLLVVFIPELRDFKSYPFNDIRRKVGDFFKLHSMNFLDLYPYFRGHDSRKLWVSYEDAHPNKVGHEIIAYGIYDYIAKEQLLK